MFSLNEAFITTPLDGIATLETPRIHIHPPFKAIYGIDMP